MPSNAEILLIFSLLQILVYGVWWGGVLLKDVGKPSTVKAMLASAGSAQGLLVLAFVAFLTSMWLKPNMNPLFGYSWLKVILGFQGAAALLWLLWGLLKKFGVNRGLVKQDVTRSLLMTAGLVQGLSTLFFVLFIVDSILWPGRRKLAWNAMVPPTFNMGYAAQAA